MYKGEDVEIGCYVQYEWLSYRLQYNPIVSFNPSIEFVDELETLRAYPKPIVSYSPDPETMNTSHTIRNVQPGQTISRTCRVKFDFTKLTAYSGRNRYANNSLEWTCTVRQRFTGK